MRRPTRRDASLRVAFLPRCQAKAASCVTAWCDVRLREVLAETKGSAIGVLQLLWVCGATSGHFGWQTAALSAALMKPRRRAAVHFLRRIKHVRRA